MKELKKRLLPLILAIVLITGILPNVAFGGVTSAETPISAAETCGKWVSPAGTPDAFGWGYLPVTLTIAGEKIISVSGNSIKKINMSTGAVELTGTTSSNREYAYLPPLYADGRIFIIQNDGIVQAFNPDTLASLWVSTPVSGQPLSAITYDNGYIYTGFWNGETLAGKFVCLNAETGAESWSIEHSGGFYFTEGEIVGGYILFTSDNGTGASDPNAAGTLYSVNKITGDVADTESIIGDGRTGVTFYNGKIYFATKAGHLYSAEVNASTGEITGLTSVFYDGSITGTPVIYNDRLYIGVGAGVSADNRIVVADADTLAEIYSVSMPGYPQSEVLLSTAYEATSGKVYLYSTYNNTPGGLIALEDSAGQVSAVSEEIYTPAAANQNWCCSVVIPDTDGNLYYSNDSGNIFALEKGEGETPSGGETTLAPEVTQFNVTVSVIGDTNHADDITHTYRNNFFELPVWVSSMNLAADSEDTAFDALIAALNFAGIGYFSPNPGYISGINGLNEFDNGPRSGWLYMINGQYVSAGSDNYFLSAGDNIVWHYTDDYSLEQASDAWNSGGAVPIVEEKKEELLEEPEIQEPEEEAPAVEFLDVPFGHFARGYIDALVSDGILSGMGENKFMPEKEISRSEFVSILFRMSNDEESDFTGVFGDIALEDWFANDVYWAYNAGITSGTGSGNFSPCASISREDMAVMLLKLSDYIGLTLPEIKDAEEFKDEGDISDYAKAAILRLQAAGIISGDESGFFNPKATATRAEAATMLGIFYNLLLGE